MVSFAGKTMLWFVDQIVDAGIEAARRDYAHAPDKMRGAVQGFEECREKDIAGLAMLLNAARLKQEKRRGEGDYWFWRCRCAEIEWVCNVVSCALYNQNQSVIVAPTARGMMMAARILGVAPVPSQGQR